MSEANFSWSELTESQKEPYCTMAEEDQKRYFKEMRTWRIKQFEKKSPNATDTAKYCTKCEKTMHVACFSKSNCYECRSKTRKSYKKGK